MSQTEAATTTVRFEDESNVGLCRRWPLLKDRS